MSETIKKELQKEISEIELKELQEDYKKLGFLEKRAWKTNKKRLLKRIEKQDKKKVETEEERKQIALILIELNEILIIVNEKGEELSNEDILKLDATEGRKILKNAVKVMEQIEG